jgi:hypothetical protein
MTLAALRAVELNDVPSLEDMTLLLALTNCWCPRSSSGTS